MSRIFRYLTVFSIIAVSYIIANTGDGTWSSYIASFLSDSKAYIIELVEQTDTPILRTGIIFILGLLMSLTPCIYPMIPITLGTLQAAAGKAKHNTFILAILYTLGIAFTFAVLGLLAAFGGAQIGTLLGNPWFIIPFIAFLGYLAFSMMGLYELHIPRFLQQQTSVSRSGGAYASAFIFGMLNGTVASPCVSPGLVMVLSIVAAQQSLTLGFIYLFTFGFGLGVPLLIIGSFSNATKIMPQAGIWMLEIKRLFGILLLSMAWYYASNIMSHTYALTLAVIIACSIAFVYLYIIQQGTSRWHQLWCIAMLAASLLSAGWWTMHIMSHEPHQETPHVIWHNQYEEARQRARENNAWMLIDFGASWCPSCNTIEKQIMHSNALQRNDLVILQVDCSNTQDPFARSMLDTFNVTNGLPAVLLVEPDEETVAARWKGELAEYTPDQFLQELAYYGVKQ